MNIHLECVSRPSERKRKAETARQHSFPTCKKAAPVLCYVPGEGKVPVVCVCFASILFFFLFPSPVFSPGANNMIGFHLCSPVMLLIGLQAGRSSFGALNKEEHALTVNSLFVLGQSRLLQKKKSFPYG